MKDHARELLNSIFTPKVQSTIYASVNRGSETAANFCRNTDFMRTSLGKLRHPNIRECAVQYALKQAAENGLIPFASKFVSNNKSSCHLELFHSETNMVITTSQVRSEMATPRSAKYRQNYSVKNDQISFCDLNPDILPAFYDEAERYAIITFNTLAATREFVRVGMPNACGRGWLDSISIIGKIESDAEDTDYRDEIMKMLIMENKGELLSGDQEKQVGNKSNAGENS